MSFQTALTREQKASIAGKPVFKDPVKEFERDYKTKRAFWVGGFLGLIIFLFSLTLGLWFAILSGLILGGIITGAMLPEENTWQS